MTETRLKLEDAATELRLALRGASADVVRSCINAFITAGRSVTLLMQKESAHVPPLKSWYKARKTQLASDPLFRFFNSQRVHIVHVGVTPPAQLDVFSPDLFSQLLDVPLDQLHERWAETEGCDAGPLPMGDMLNMGPDTLTSWRFPEVGAFLPGDSGDVFRLCRLYLARLRILVDEWENEARGVGA